MSNKIIMMLILAASVFAVAGCKTTVADQQVQGQTNQAQIIAAFEHGEKVRAACIEGRRLVCGKILEVFPEGLVVDSGYTNLLREPLTQSWLVPSTVVASRAENLVEQNNPGAMCIGPVFLTNYPKGKRIKLSQYDYVIMEAYPVGQCTYTSMGTIERTVRKFSASLDIAVKLNLKAEDKIQAAAPKVK